MGQRFPPWSFTGLALWAGCLPAKGVLRRSAKGRISAAGPNCRVSIGSPDGLFQRGALESLPDALEGHHRDLCAWWKRRLNASMQGRARFPLAMVYERGPAGLEGVPRIIVGTIRSVKGGEAGVVFLFPDLSQAGDPACQCVGPARDAVIRLLCVGVTRTRQALCLWQRESAMAFHW